MLALFVALFRRDSGGREGLTGATDKESGRIHIGEDKKTQN